jgi:hypothetical protein
MVRNLPLILLTPTLAFNTLVLALLLHQGVRIQSRKNAS